MEAEKIRWVERLDGLDTWRWNSYIIMKSGEIYWLNMEWPFNTLGEAKEHAVHDFLQGNPTLTLSEDKASLVPVPTETTTITREMSAAEILEHLRRHGCQDITSKLDASKSSEYPISSGGFGDVYRGALHDESLVAVKCLRLHMDSSDVAKKQLKHAARELYVWSKCNHPNVLGLVGVAQYKNQIAMVSPWMEHSSIRRFLGSRPGLDRYNMCIQIAAGVMYLHSVGVVHGDIKGDNVLISDELVPKLTDFGNAALREYTLKFSSTTSRASTSLNWAAPELLDEDVTLTTEADVYALGMTILEVITGSIPYAGMREPTVVTKIITKVHPTRSEEYIPSGITHADLLWALLKSCWAFNPRDRPISDEVWSRMNSIILEKNRKD